MKKSGLIFFFLILLSASAKANLVLLTRELIQNNFGIFESKAEIESSKNEVEAIYSKIPWTLLYKGAVTENRRDYLIPYVNYNAQFWDHEVGIEKDFLFGGKFTFKIMSSDQYRYPENAAVINGGTPKIFEVAQNTSYIQDLGKNLFGRQEFKEVEVREKNEKKAENASDLEIESKVLEFFQAYIDVRQAKNFIWIEERALERSKERVTVIRRKVKEGLRLKVDLLEAKYNKIQYEEQLKRAKINLESALETLSNLLHREVKKNELDLLDPFGKVLPMDLKSKGDLMENKNVKYLESQIAALEANLEKINYGFFPDLNLEADYYTNSIEPDKSTARKNGIFGPNYELKGIINLSWPIGFEQEETNRVRSSINLNIAKVERNAYLNNIKNSEKFILNRLKKLEEILKIGKNRWDISKEVVENYNKLYGMGKSTILESLTAEQNRILTERSYLSNLAEREKLYASLAFIWGNLKETIFKLK